MGEIRTIKVTFRLTESEAAKFQALMEMEGYRSMSRYTRDKVLSGRIRRRRNLSQNEANISKQMELLRLEIKRIGVNYNQVVRAVNSAVAYKRDGVPVVRPGPLAHSLEELKLMMEEILVRLKDLDGIVNNNY